MRLGDQRVFFLGWTEMYMSEGFREVWYTDESDAMGMLDGSLATPASREQGFSLTTAIRNDILPGRIDPDSGLGGIALSTLADVIEDEARRTRG